jgi:sigma-B regulation protein RsbU (phosphoserine phosphatase)
VIVRSTAAQKLTLQNDTAELARLSRWAGRLADDLGASERDRFRVDLVLTEVVTNAITHGLKASPGAELVVEAEWNDPMLSVTVTDRAPPFDPLAAPLPDFPRSLEEAEPGGLGLVLIRKYIDDARYVRLEKQNRLTLVFRWSVSGAAVQTTMSPVEFELCRSHLLLRDLPLPALESMVAHCQLRSLGAGEVLLTPGVENHTVYFLLQGQLEVQLPHTKASNSFLIPPGEIAGDMSVIEHRPAGALVSASQPSVLLAMPEELFWEKYCSQPMMIQPLLQSLVSRVRKTDGLLQAEFHRQVRYEMLQRELKSAALIQAHLLPSAVPLFANPAVDVHTLFKPAREVGGDFYDAVVIDRNLLAVAVGDVCGKGMPAALFMVRAVTVLRMILSQEGDPARILPALNRQLCTANDEFMFVTLAIVIVDTDTGRATYLNGGHNPALFASSGKTFEIWDPPAGTLVGVNATSAFAVVERQLQDGDTIVLYTDGVTEAENSQKEMFGLGRTLSELSRLPRPKSMDVLVCALETAVTDFVGGAEPSDDVTLLALTYRSRERATEEKL